MMTDSIEGDSDKTVPRLFSFSDDSENVERLSDISNDDFYYEFLHNSQSDQMVMTPTSINVQISGIEELRFDEIMM
jgi:hypothetical protein